MKIYIKLYSKKTSQMNEILNRINNYKLSKKPNVSYIRLRGSKQKIVYRKGPCGKGYAVWNKYELVLRKSMICCEDIETYNHISNKILQIKGVYTKTVFR